MNNLFKLNVLFNLSVIAVSTATAHTHITAGAFDADDSGSIEIGDVLVASGLPTSPIEFTFNEGTSTPGVDGFLFESDFTFAAYDSFSYNTNTQIGGAMDGSVIWLQYLGLTSAPAGGAFAFYENGATDPTFQSDMADGTELIGAVILSDLSYAPFGHVHGRLYTLSKAGTYTTQWKLVDATGVQADSDVFTIEFTAVPEPAQFSLLAAFGALALVGLRRRLRSSNRR